MPVCVSYRLFSLSNDTELDSIYCREDGVCIPQTCSKTCMCLRVCSGDHQMHAMYSSKPSTTNPVSLNPGQSGEREWRERSRVSSIKITMLFNSGLIKSAFSPPSEAQDQTAAGDSQPHKSLSSSGFVFNHCFFTLRQRAFYSKLMLVYTAGLLK